MGNDHLAEQWQLNLCLPKEADREKIPTPLWDLIAIALKSYELDAHDRARDRYHANSHSNWVPVECPAFWQTEAASNELFQVLRDFWQKRVELELLSPSEDRYMKYQISITTQDTVSVSRATQGTRIHAFSITPDCLAAVQRQLENDQEDLVLVTLEDHLTAARRVDSLAEMLEHCFPAARSQVVATSLCSLTPFAPSIHGTSSLLHLLVAIAVALALDIDEICFPQNGIENLQLPVTMAAIAMPSARTANPGVTEALSSLISRMVGRHFAITNPFLSNTPNEVSNGLLVGDGSIPQNSRPAVESDFFATNSRCPEARLDRSISALSMFTPRASHSLGLHSDPLNSFAEPVNDNLVESFIQNIREFPKLPDSELARRLANLPGVRWYSRQSQYAVVKSLLLRHIEKVTVALTEVVRHFAGRLVTGTLPPSSFIARVASPAQTETIHHPTFQQRGQKWIIWFGDGNPLYLNTTLGMKYIHLLLQYPKRDYSAIELRAAVEGQAVLINSTMSVVDAKSLSSYRAYLRELRMELQVANDNNDLGRASQVQREIEKLSTEIRRCAGPGGRPREIGEIERARKSVSNAIHRTLRKIRSVHPAFAMHLAATLQIGTYLRYDPSEEISWIT
ncbi:MAG: hypothetical protein MJE77_05415 [Proteobacteria bacterium]|nr:hypothetical protein [Pseudomonadota bacterium]